MVIFTFCVLVFMPLIAVPFALIAFYQWLIEDVLGINDPRSLGDSYSYIDRLKDTRAGWRQQVVLVRVARLKLGVSAQSVGLSDGR